MSLETALAAMLIWGWEARSAASPIDGAMSAAILNQAAMARAFMVFSMSELAYLPLCHRNERLHASLELLGVSTSVVSSRARAISSSGASGEELCGMERVPTDSTQVTDT